MLCALWSNPPASASAACQRILAAMAERRMAEVVGEAQGLGQILVEAERAGDGPADLRDFEAVGQADPEMVAVGRDEHLGLVAQAAEGDRMDDPVAVALEDVARAARPGVCFRMGPAARSLWAARRELWKRHSVGSFLIVWPGGLVQLNASTRTLSRSSTKIFASSLLRNGPISSRARSGSSAT